jgi:archaellum component FlaC
MSLEIENEIREMRQEIRTLTEEVRKLSQSCNRMDGHISFVERVYTRFSHPLNVLKDKVESVFGRSSEIEYNE